jgi:hypothetical protein
VAIVDEPEEGMPDAAAYRVKAREMRARAGSTHDPVAYQELVSLAAQYEALARQIELSSPKNKQESRPEPSD